MKADVDSRSGELTPRQTRKAATRRRVLDAARELFDAEGYVETTIRKIEKDGDGVLVTFSFRIGPYASGLLAVFPVVLTSVILILHNRAGGKPITREELLTEVWGYNAGVTTHTLETHVYRLRQKIEPDPANARLLMTDAGGYRLQF